MGIETGPSGPYGPVQDWLEVYQGEGNGYGKTSLAELEFLRNISCSTGLIFDQVYSGKALYHLLMVARLKPDIFQTGQNVLFIHTGGLFGLYGCVDMLSDVLPPEELAQL